MLQHYAIRSEILSIDGSAATHRLVKVSTQQLAVWNSAHDASGRLIEEQSEKKRDTDDFKA